MNPKYWGGKKKVWIIYIENTLQIQQQIITIKPAGFFYTQWQLFFLQRLFSQSQSFSTNGPKWHFALCWKKTHPTEHLLWYCAGWVHCDYFHREGGMEGLGNKSFVQRSASPWCCPGGFLGCFWHLGLALVELCWLWLLLQCWRWETLSQCLFFLSFSNFPSLWLEWYP